MPHQGRPDLEKDPEGNRHRPVGPPLPSRYVSRVLLRALLTRERMARDQQTLDLRLGL